MQTLNILDLRVHPGDSAFLIDDGQTAIVYDSGFAFTGNQLCERVAEVLGDRKLDYVFLTHSHYDHALGSAYLKRRYPDCCVVASEYAAKIFQKPSAREMMRTLDRKVAETAVVDSYEDLIDSLGVDLAVAEGDTVGSASLRFAVVALPGHTKCSVGYYCRERGLLLGSETLGVYDGDAAVLPAYLVGYQTAMASIERARALGAMSILVPHYGLLEGDAAARYLAWAKAGAKETAEWIVSCLRAGQSDREIIEAYKERVYYGYVRTIYPVDAMELNTGIMIDLCRRELFDT